ncbi:MAG: TIGR02757 family protein [Deltaproteobacteria bacterium]|nr:TIGR02757 family protein [Deltaproteobacteria bacterium]
MSTARKQLIRKEQLESLYAFYNSRKWVHPDPLEFLYDYGDLKDREVAGLIASSLAYGRVAQILKSVSGVLEKMGPSPYGFLLSATPSSLRRIFSDFKHRFTTGEELALMLMGAKSVIERYGSLYECFLSGFKDDDRTILTGLSCLVNELRINSNGRSNSLLPLPERGSACKRWNLFLRWMVRKDQVDPGGWNSVSPARLIIPLDTHMHRICLSLKLTGRKNADMRTAIEITSTFGKIEPEDPVRYDFALTRLGIRKDADLDAFLACLEIS